VRVGNEEYARSNRSFGMTTLRKRHVQLAGSGIRIEFKGKGGKQHCVSVSDRRVARIVGRCQELPGQLLFQYLDEAGERRQVTSNDVNDYIREATAGDFTAKDVRTWAGTVVAANALLEVSDGDEESEARLKRDVVQAVELVAEELGNTPAIARKCYIHPAVLDAYLTGSLKPVMQDAARTRKRSKWLNREEATVAGALDKLQRRR
jgi:DNA topoisomerase-1